MTNDVCPHRQVITIVQHRRDFQFVIKRECEDCGKYTNLYFDIREDPPSRHLPEYYELEADDER